MTNRLVIHITFFFMKDRIKYINRIIDETNNYQYQADIFIHTNDDNVRNDYFHKYVNGTLCVVHHNLHGIHPYYLSWKCRELMTEQKDKYETFMYIEDDILVPWSTIEYWLKYHKDLIKNGYNLGFVRIEVEDNIEYITDITHKMHNMISINSIKYCVNDVNPYCAFWIYDKDEFNKFVTSKYYDCNNIINYETRESSAIGLHGLGTNWYKNTIIPIMDNKLIENCKIYHMPNNYVQKKSVFASIKFDEAIAM